jgi:hypothetical protein
MAIHVTCSCGKVLQARDEDAGREAQCSACGRILTVPYISEPPATSSVRCDVCGGDFSPRDVYNEGGRIICKGCYGRSVETEPERRSEYLPPRRYRSFDDEPGPRRNIPTHLAEAILVTIFCCWAFGIPAIVYAAQVNGKMQMGDYRGAEQASASAATWCWVSFGIGLAVKVIALIYWISIAAKMGRQAL